MDSIPKDKVYKYPLYITFKQTLTYTVLCFQSVYYSMWLCLAPIAPVCFFKLVARQQLSTVNILILLDLTAAFDTINHSILLSRIQSSFNITGTALSWLTSYLTDTNSSTSTTVNPPLLPSPKGIPQGSVLGPHPLHPIQPTPL